MASAQSAALRPAMIVMQASTLHKTALNKARFQVKLCLAGAILIAGWPMGPALSSVCPLTITSAAKAAPA